MAVSLARRCASAIGILLLAVGIAQAQIATIDWTGGVSPTDAEMGGEEPQTLLFGSKLATDGPTLLAGMPEYNGGRGRVAVFAHRGPGDWPRTATFSARDVRAGDLFGAGVAVSGGTALVTSKRALYVFKRNANNKWTQAQRLAAPNNEWFTGAVQLSGSWVAAGIDNAKGKGAVLVYSADAKGVWSSRTRLTSFDQEAFDAFGQTLALWQDTLVVGAPAKDKLTGAAYVFKRVANRWTQQQKLLPFDGATEGNFGHSVALHGNVIVVGAPYANHEGGIAAEFEYLISGSAYVFSRQGRGWNAMQRLRPDKEEVSWYQTFGESVAIANGRVAVSAAWPVQRWDPGFVFMFELHRRSYLLQSLLLGDASVGDDIVMSDVALIAGVPYDFYYSIGYALIHEFDLAF